MASERDWHDRVVRVIENERDVATVELTESELTILANAVNEVCHGPEAIPESEFVTRIGASRQDAEALLGSIGRLL